jgi:hypothetical protein
LLGKAENVIASGETQAASEYVADLINNEVLSEQVAL